MSFTYIEPEIVTIQNGGATVGGTSAVTNSGHPSLSGGLVCGGSSDPGPWLSAIDTCPGDSYGNAAIVRPTTNQQLDYITRSVYVGGTGDLAYVLPNGVSITLTAVPTGTMLKIRAKQILKTGTTATSLVGFW
jgi:hypothetical protein